MVLAISMAIGCVTISPESDSYLLANDCNRRIEMRVQEGSNTLYKNITQYLIYVEQTPLDSYKAGIIKNPEWHWHSNIKWLWQKFLE